MAFKKRHFLSTPLFAFAGRAGGMIIPFFIAYYYGAGSETDAFFFAFAIVFFIFGLFQQVFESMLLPYLAEHNRRDIRAGAAFISRVSAYFVPGLGILCLLIWLVLPGFLTRASGLGAASSELAAKLFLQMIPFLLLGVLVSGINGIFNTSRVFWFPAFSPFIRSVVVVLCMVLFHDFLGIFALPGGFVAGEFIRWALSLLLMVRLGLWKFGLQPESSVKLESGFARQVGYQVMALAAVQMMPLGSQWFASYLGHGGLSVLNYADRLYAVPFQIFLAGMSQIFLSHWTEAYSEHPEGIFRRNIHRDLGVTLVVSFVISGVLWLLRKPVVLILYGHGGLTAFELQEITGLFGWFVLGLSPAIAGSLYLRLLFVMRKAEVFCILSWGKLILHLVLTGILILFAGIQGLAIATTLANIAALIAIHIYVQSQWKEAPLG